jgi:hypothetical protein
MITRLRTLACDTSGAILVEMALALPLLMIAGLGCAEIANYALTVHRVRNITTMVADNAARMGANSALASKQITESEINDLLLGASQQSGTLAITNNGRIILSSLEKNPSGGNWIHWQRCIGKTTYKSSYGVQGDGATGTTFKGMNGMTAMTGTAIMYVEVVYAFKPIIGTSWMAAKDIRDTAVMMVREKRDLTQVYNSEAATASTC